MGWLTSTRDSKGVLTTYGLDTLGRNISKTITNAAGTTSITTSTTYDANGNVLTETDGRNNTTTYTYDDLDRKSTAKNVLNQTTTYTYDDNGNLIEETNYLGNTTKKIYDGINRLIEVKDAGNNIVQQILYNDADAQISSFDALGNQTQFIYDKNLRQVGTIDGKGNTSSMVYDARGNISTKTDARGNTTIYTYDGENNLLSVKDALNNITSYTYDNNGNKITQKDGNGNITTYTYNVANKLITKTDPTDNGVAGLSETYTYYYNGLMATKTDRNKVTTTYTYDDFGRLLTENAGGEIQSYTYDNNGNLLTMTDASGTTTREYDALNRNTKKTVPGIGTSTYSYDLPTGTTGEYLEKTTDPKGNITSKTYDKVGRLSKVTAGGETTSYEYYKNGRQFKVTYPNTTTETYYYDANNQVTKLVNSKADGSVISSYQYDYDKAGNQTVKIEEKGTTTYTYDKLNRLDSVTEPIVVNNASTSKITSYLYDGAGNRKSEKVTIGDKYTNTLYSYNALNRLTATLNSAGEEIHYIYDNNGNLLNKTVGASTMETLADTMQVGADSSVQAELPSFDLLVTTSSDFGTGTKSLTQYTYNKFNRLTTMKDEDSSASYIYNAQGYRVEKTVNGQTTDYLYEGDKVVLETDKSNNQKAVQVYGNNLLSRSVTGVEKYYYLYNAHGDVTSLINTAGVVTASYDYDAFGNIISKAGAANNSILYAGYQHDDESGLYYLNARYYDSVTARFITEDTYKGKGNDPLSLNLYTYCINNPIIYYDPSGNKAKKATAKPAPTPAPTKAPTPTKASSTKATKSTPEAKPAPTPSPSKSSNNVNSNVNNSNKSRSSDSVNDFAKENGGNVVLNKKTGTVTVTINGKTCEYKVGKFGTYIDKNGDVYIPPALLYRDFGLNQVKDDDTLCVEYVANKEGLGKNKGYSINSSLTIDKQKGLFGTNITSTSYTVYTFKDTRSGDKITDAVNDYENDIASDALTIYGLMLSGAIGAEAAAAAGISKGVSAAGVTEAIINVAPDAVDVCNVFINPDYSLKLEAGDTVITSDTFNTKLGSTGRPQITSTIYVYNETGDLKCAMTFRRY